MGVEIYCSELESIFGFNWGGEGYPTPEEFLHFCSVLEGGGGGQKSVAFVHLRSPRPVGIAPLLPGDSNKEDGVGWKESVVPSSPLLGTAVSGGFMTV